MPSLQEFPMCCGASIVYGFSADPEKIAAFEYNNYGEYKIDKDGKRIGITGREQFNKSLDDKLKHFPNRMICCILNKKQFEDYKGAWPKLLKERGFKFVCGWSNSSHDGSYGVNYQNGRVNEVVKEATIVHPNYLFVLCTDEKGKYGDHTKPPAGWEEIPSPSTP